MHRITGKPGCGNILALINGVSPFGQIVQLAAFGQAVLDKTLFAPFSSTHAGRMLEDWLLFPPCPIRHRCVPKRAVCPELL
jgi:hypothetical protein